MMLSVIADMGFSAVVSVMIVCALLMKELINLGSSSGAGGREDCPKGHKQGLMPWAGLKSGWPMSRMGEPPRMGVRAAQTP